MKFNHKNFGRLGNCLERTKFRSSYRAYRNLRGENRLDFINDLFTNFRKMDYEETYKLGGVEFSGVNLDQYLVHRLCRGNLITRLLRAKEAPMKPKAFAIPSVWHSVLEKHGVQVGRLRSFVAWKLLASTLLLYSIYLGLRSLVESLKTNPGSNHHQLVYLHGLADSNLPAGLNDFQSKNIINWFRKNQNRQHFAVTGSFETDFQKYKGEIVRLKTPFFGLRKLDAIRACFKFLWIASDAAADAVFGKGFKAVMCYEVMQKYLATLLRREFIASQYAFHNSYFIYRPLWTEVMERRGASVVLYYYSLNCFPFHIDGALKAMYFGYQNLTWPQHLVWNDLFPDFVKKISLGNPRIDLVEPIYFSDNSKKIKICNKALIIFDVTPPRDVFYSGYGSNVHYYSDQTSILFFEVLIKIAKEYELTLLIKQKRPANLSVETSKRFRNYMQTLIDNDHVELCDGGVSAYRALQNAIGAVSMPFTSTAHIAKSMHIPSVYFDSTGRISSAEPGALGVPLLQSPQSLANWVSSKVINPRSD